MKIGLMSEPPPPSEERAPLSRLFIVPLIIVSVIVACTVVVVLSFGWIANSGEIPLDQLLNMIDQSSGARTANVALMPRDKEVWQAAQELALRLEHHEIAPADMPKVQSRIVAVLEEELKPARTVDDAGQREASLRLTFMMHVAARAKAAAAVPLLVEALDSNDREVRREALVALALMKGVEQAEAAVPRITPVLRDPDPVVRMVCCATLSNLAAPAPAGAEARDALAAIQVNDPEREVRWNASLTLARLGDARAVEHLLEMLTRNFWENQRTTVLASAAADDTGHPLPAEKVANYLVASMDAAAGLGNVDVWAAIERLRDDPALKVAGRARQLVDER